MTGFICTRERLRPDSELAKREVSILLLGLQQLLGGLALGKATADSPGLLDAQIKRLVLGLLEADLQLSLLSLIDDSQDTSNALAKLGANRWRKPSSQK